jgi:hypothetical protein
MFNDALLALPFGDLRSLYSVLFALMRFIYRGLLVIVMALLFSAQRSGSAAAPRAVGCNRLLGHFSDIAQLSS